MRVGSTSLRERRARIGKARQGVWTPTRWLAAGVNRGDQPNLAGVTSSLMVGAVNQRSGLGQGNTGCHISKVISWRALTSRPHMRHIDILERRDTSGAGGEVDSR